MPTQENLFQTTARVWFQSISLSAVLITMFLIFDNYKIHNMDSFVHAVVNGRLMNGILYSGFVFLIVGTFGIPALFASYLGFQYVGKLKLKEFTARPLMIVISMAILTVTFMSVFKTAHLSTNEYPILGILIFATTFMVMLDDTLVKSISVEA